MYGGYTGDVRLDIVRIPYGYRTDITEALPLLGALSQNQFAEPKSLWGNGQNLINFIDLVDFFYS